MAYANNIPTNEKVFTPMTGSEIPSIIADVLEESPYAEDDPARPVDDMIKAMTPQRKVMMGILRFCTGNPAMSEIKTEVDRLKEFLPSVYTAYDMCVLLEEAGGLERVNADGEPYDTSDIEPIIYTDEATGATYYQANEPEDMHFNTTAAGQTILDDDDPVGRAQKYFDEDPDLLKIYKRVLVLCENGASITQLEEACDHDDLLISHNPLIVSNTIYVEFFIDRLEKSDCIEWPGAWTTTDYGHQALELLSDVEDDFDYDAFWASQEATAEE